jgi:hypothetical protein
VAVVVGSTVIADFGRGAHAEARDGGQGYLEYPVISIKA